MARGRIWTGANDRDRTRGDFIWDGVGGKYSLPSTYWGPDEPSLDKDSRCVSILIYQNYRFGDFMCVKPRPYICEN